ncbi:MAG: hypothetical protein ABA06_04405 [Parcubacteria bacterium C7867-001]|nr:MAG: hypothetical protein ABA06_04405 [Parcubacteria bacterium C7867-001]
MYGLLKDAPVPETERTEPPRKVAPLDSNETRAMEARIQELVEKTGQSRQTILQRAIRIAMGQLPTGCPGTNLDCPHRATCLANAQD